MLLLDTTKYQDGLGSWITGFVLQILSWLAEEERTEIKIRQKEEIQLAQKQGKHLGRPKAEITSEFITDYNRWKTEGITAVDAMKLANMEKKYEASLSK